MRVIEVGDRLNRAEDIGTLLEHKPFRVMAVCDGWAMMRRKGAMPCVEAVSRLAGKWYTVHGEREVRDASD